MKWMAVSVEEREMKREAKKMKKIYVVEGHLNYEGFEIVMVCQEKLTAEKIVEGLKLNDLSVQTVLAGIVYSKEYDFLEISEQELVG